MTTGTTAAAEPAVSPHARKRRAGRGAIVVAVSSLLLVGGVVLSAALGQLPISAQDVVGSVLRAVGIDNAWAPTDDLIEQTLWKIRFPRVAMSLLVGAALAIAGAVMQAVFGNPLAEPGVVGVSSGAALGAAAAISFGLSFLGGWTIAAFAFLGGLVATLLVYGTARAQGRTETVTLLLTGVAINAFAGAGLALITFLGDTQSREQIVFWQLGSINGSRWNEVVIVAIVGVCATAIVASLARQFDLLALGDRTASHLGIKVERLRIASVVLVALLTGVGVAFVGIISFVGLVVPHLVRMLLGPAHRMLFAVSILGGAALLVWADLLARTLVPASDLPIGMLTALVGGPFFYWLIRRNRRQAGGMGVTAETGAGLSIVNASYRIGGTTILDKVSVDVRCGRVLVLVGPNGAGKSTLLGMLAGDADPTGGDVLLHGRPLGQWPPRERARRRAVLLQSNQLVFPFTAQQVIEMGRAPWIGTEESADDDRAIARAIEATDSGHLLTRAFPTLSGGEKARVSLARVLAQETPIVLLDEPTAALDLRHQEDVLRIARDRARAGAAVVIVLHDLSLAAAYADEVMILDAGRAVASGSPNEVLTAERIEAVYGLAVRILRDDDTGRPLVVPRRGRIRRPHSADGRTAT